MYRSGGGRVGPSRTTPANTQCQKCLKRGHYSYECKAAPQERPYVPRPSRTQQLLNPKLRPDLSNDTPELIQKKAGVADAELAKRAAQRESESRGRGLRDDDNEVLSGTSGARSTQNRRRSRSYDSNPSGGSMSPASPRPGRESMSPQRTEVASLQRRSDSPRSDRSYSRSLSRSLSPVSQEGRRGGQHSDSPQRRYSSPERLLREPQRHKSYGHGKHSDLRDRSRSPQRRQDSHRGRFHERRRQQSRSPRREPSIDDKGRRAGEARQYRDRGGQHSRPDTKRQASPSRSNLSSRREGAPRERSLSPFSRRLALTQAMNR
ncbi:hypothetical protein MCOR02_003936 [Pyricularia oryzae]|nr:hypothetical protein MCOR02_003936 [Pyricularia oryzae]